MMFQVLVGACLLAGNAKAQGHISEAVAELLQKEKDFELESTQRARFDADDWITPFEAPEDPPPSWFVQSFVEEQPLLATLPGDGAGFALLNLQPCGLSQPHIHPRGTEWYFVIEGSLDVGVVQENGPGETILNHITQYQGHIAPQGLLHWHYNNNCEPTKFVASFNHRDPGTLLMSERYLMNIPDEVLGPALGLSQGRLMGLKRRYTENVLGGGFPFQVNEDCAKRCGL